jgi:bromodomain-containing protein 7/9
MPTRKDDYAFFLEPVNLEKVPGYMDVIKQPMDFGTMADKVSRSKYRSLEEFAVRSFSFPFSRTLNF